MTGPLDSIIGDEIQGVLDRFLTQTPARFSVGSGHAILNSVLVELDEARGKAKSITRIDRVWTQ